MKSLSGLYESDGISSNVLYTVNVPLLLLSVESLTYLNPGSPIFVLNTFVCIIAPRGKSNSKGLKLCSLDICF